MEAVRAQIAEIDKKMSENEQELADFKDKMLQRQRVLLKQREELETKLNTLFRTECNKKEDENRAREVEIQSTGYVKNRRGERKTGENNLRKGERMGRGNGERMGRRRDRKERKTRDGGAGSRKKVEGD